MSFLYVLYALYGSKKTFMSFFYVLYVKKKLYVLLLCPVHLIWFKKKLISSFMVQHLHRFNPLKRLRLCRHDDPFRDFIHTFGQAHQVIPRFFSFCGKVGYLIYFPVLDEL